MPATTPRVETFVVEDGHLVRKVIPRRGEPYEHRCPLDAYREPWASYTNAAVAIAYWKERGLLDIRRRRNHVDDGFFFEDAMIEFHALAENG